ncbi:hypothetical protein Nepgr_025393 [Nepenthes gracilis]|uniref:Uncharacterized protein n=1 Tax=Nepenthes gracilis TaxID=150966 RepID=A0AAD3Y107_NEPGR|nr:hypothetical protein Nepgr_025393 [Nepenthes gracilis]
MPDPATSVSKLNQFDGGAVPSKAYDMETLGRAQLAGDHQYCPWLDYFELGRPRDFSPLSRFRRCLGLQFSKVSWLSLARDSVSVEAVDQLLLSPSSTISNSTQLSPTGMDAAPDNIALPAQAVERLQATANVSGSYATIMMRGLQTNGVEVPSSSDQPLQSGELSSCPSMGKLKHNLDVIRGCALPKAVFGLKAKFKYLACSLSLMYYAAGVSLAEASWSSFLVFLMFTATAESLCLMKLMEMT